MIHRISSLACLLSMLFLFGLFGLRPLFAAQSAPPEIKSDSGLEAVSDDETWAEDEFADDGEVFEQTAPFLEIRDPLEPFNRAMFKFNDRLYFWALKPLARGYRAIVPKPARIGVRNFFDNLTTPIRMVNCVLQGKFHGAAKEWARFLYNSTVGVLGFVDAAQKYEALEPAEEDFGQTLGRYGLGPGIYLNLPLLGPSSLRDSFGLAADSFLNPVSYLEPWASSLGVRVYEKVNATSLTLGDYETFKEAAFEPYEAFRDAYIQYRHEKVKE